MKNFLVNNYYDMTSTHDYIIGFVENKAVKAYMVTLNKKDLETITKLDKASSKNGGTYSLKFAKPNKTIRRYIQAKATKEVIVCSQKYLEELFQTSNLNRGQLFENLAVTYFNLTQTTKRNANFTQCGDAHDENGIEYQIKFERAVFTDERTIQNLRAKA